MVLDLFSKLIVGWSMHHRQDRQMVLRAVEMAVWQCRGDYQRFLKCNALLCSMSAVGHCGDNAACEGFFGMLKRERMNRKTYPTLDVAKADLFDYIERFHNPRMRRRVANQDLKFSSVSKPSVEMG